MIRCVGRTVPSVRCRPRPCLRTTAAAAFSGKSISSKICFLGGGQMTEAILGALDVKNVQEMSRITVVDPNASRLQQLHDKLGVQTTQNPNEGIEGAEIVVLAVKPQNVSSLAASLTVEPPPLLLSIVAGLTISDMKKLFHTDHIIRTMPNTPAMVLEGVTVWMATDGMPAHLKAAASALLSSFGEEIEVHDENYIDMATAVSGSGPGYVFLTMEAMTDAAVHLGFPRSMAEKLVFATIKGSAIYAQRSDKHTAKLRNSVTSPGGTTASALYAMEKGGFRTVVADAIWAAYRRTLELGSGSSSGSSGGGAGGTGAGAGRSSDVGPGRGSRGQGGRPTDSNVP